METSSGKERLVLNRVLNSDVLTDDERRAVLAALGHEGRQTLRSIAVGELPVDDPKVRGKAILALGDDTTQREASTSALQAVLATDDPRLKIVALRALERLDPDTAEEAARDLVSDQTTSTSTAVTLAAAEILARGQRAEDIAKLRELREQLRSLRGDSASPSIVALDRMITTAARPQGSPAVSDQPPIG